MWSWDALGPANIGEGVFNSFCFYQTKYVRRRTYFLLITKSSTLKLLNPRAKAISLERPSHSAWL